jgi:hypothetical protein
VGKFAHYGFDLRKPSMVIGLPLLGLKKHYHKKKENSEFTVF